MGIYVNPRNKAFQEAVNSAVYVDKSKLISYTNSVLSTNRKNLCVSRPHRFGKSMAADMLVAINYDTESKVHSCVIEKYVREESGDFHL